MYQFEIQVMVVVVIMGEGKAKKPNFFILFSEERSNQILSESGVCVGKGVLFQEAKNKLKNHFLSL